MLTLANIDNKSPGDGGSIDPLAGKVLNLKPLMGRGLQELFPDSDSVQILFEGATRHIRKLRSQHHSGGPRLGRSMRHSRPQDIARSWRGAALDRLCRKSGKAHLREARMLPR